MHIRITAIPSTVVGQQNDPLQTHNVFARAVGNEFQVRGLNLVGDYELWLTDAGEDDSTCGNHTVWIEPECTETLDADEICEATIYVRLMDEGTDVWRPVLARNLGNNKYRILSNETKLEGERWEFQPGEKVYARMKNFHDRTEHPVAATSA